MDLVDKAFDLGPKYGVNEWWRHYWKILKILDRIYDLRMHIRVKEKMMIDNMSARNRILIAAVEVPGREKELSNVINHMRSTLHHEVDVTIIKMAPVGKFQNIENSLIGIDLEKYDWLVITDDDVELPNNFLDDFLWYANKYKISIAQPAHKFLSFSTFKVTRRHWNSLARKTGFVEIGPVTLLHRDVLKMIIPFPDLRWAWGLDMHWAHLAKQFGFSMGVIDAVPLRHLRPIAISYSSDAAIRSAKDFLRRTGFDLSKSEMFSSGERIA